MTVANESKVSSVLYPDASPLVDRVHWTVVFVLMPSVAICGLVGDSLSIVVLYRQGFKKSSNILLFALAISDTLFLIGTNGPAKVMYEWGPGGFWFPEDEARVWFYFYQLGDYLNWCAASMSMGLPVLITIERCIAVFLPLKFHTIVTPRRTVTAIIVLIFLTYMPQVYIRMWLQFDYVFDPIRNSSVGLAVRTDLWYNQQRLVGVLREFYKGVFYFVIIVGSGSLAISIKISIAAANRKRMVSGGGAAKTTGVAGQSGQSAEKTATTSRTTKMLLALCTVYFFSGFFFALPTFFPDTCIYPLFTEQTNYKSVQVFMYHVIKLDLCINASCNFIIYVAMNKNFRDTFLEMFRQKSQSGGGNRPKH